jgi:hypothetical protein
MVVRNKTLKLYNISLKNKNNTIRKTRKKKKKKRETKSIKAKTQKGGTNPEWRRGPRRVPIKEIEELQSQINENILYDEYDWTKTFQPKQIGDSTYNHLLGLNNPELMTQNYLDLLTFVNHSILDFKSNTETVKIYLVEEDKLSEEYKTELKEQEQAYKKKYQLETAEPVDLVEGMIKPRKDDTIYFEELDDKFTTMHDFLKERQTNLEECIIKEKKKENGTDGPNTEYFQHEIASCSALITDYNELDKSNKQSLTEFVGKISDTLYYNKVFYELNRNYDELIILLEEYLSNANEIDKQILISFIPLQFFNENNDLQIGQFIDYLKTNSYQHQQFIYGLARLLKIKFNNSLFNNSNYVNNNSSCGDFIYWSYRFNTYYMYLSAFSNYKIFPSKFILPYNYEYPNYKKFITEIDKTLIKPKIKKIIKEKDTFAFAISSYKSQMFIPEHINELEFIGCLMIKFKKELKGINTSVLRIWIIFIFKNSNSYYESNVTGSSINFVMCNIQFYITENANITYRQLVSYKELKQYYYQSIKQDINTGTILSFFKINTEGMIREDKYKPFLFITRRNIEELEFKEVIKRANLKKYNLELVGEKDKIFKEEKYKYGLTGDIFYLEEDIAYNTKIISS